MWCTHLWCFVSFLLCAYVHIMIVVKTNMVLHNTGQNFRGLWRSWLDHVMFVPKPRIFISTFMLFQPLPILALLWPLISMGFITDLLALSTSYNSILVVVDLLTKIVHIIFYAKIITNEKIFKLFFSDVF